jgi:hypothetical protein
VAVKFATHLEFLLMNGLFVSNGRSALTKKAAPIPVKRSNIETAKDGR